MDSLQQSAAFKLSRLPQATRERIAHIDFILLFNWEAVRADLVDRFSIAAVQVTKDSTMYRELSPGNIEYSQKLKLHKRGEATEQDHGMKGGVLKVDIRAVTAGYLLRLWNFDYTKDAQLKPPRFHLWLKNYQTLYGVGNLAVVPGFDSVSELGRI